MRIITSEAGNKMLAGTWLTGGRKTIDPISDVLTQNLCNDRLGFTIETSPALVDTETAYRLIDRLKTAIENGNDLADDELLASAGIIPTGGFTHFTRDYHEGQKVILAKNMSSRHAPVSSETFFEWVAKAGGDEILTAATFNDGRHITATSAIPELPEFDGVDAAFLTFATSCDGSFSNMCVPSVVLSGLNIPVRVITPKKTGWKFKNTTNTSTKIDDILLAWDDVRDIYTNFKNNLRIMKETPFDFEKLVSHLMAKPEDRSTRAENNASMLWQAYDQASDKSLKGTVYAAVVALHFYDAMFRDVKEDDGSGRSVRQFDNMVSPLSWVKKGRAYIEHNISVDIDSFCVAF